MSNVRPHKSQPYSDSNAVAQRKLELAASSTSAGWTATIETRTANNGVSVEVFVGVLIVVLAIWLIVRFLKKRVLKRFDEESRRAAVELGVPLVQAQVIQFIDIGVGELVDLYVATSLPQSSIRSLPPATRMGHCIKAIYSRQGK